ncbi:MAG: lipopolysaccharide assembly protein LapA domain-containing protein [Nocardioidaceae bacterium]
MAQTSPSEDERAATGDRKRLGGGAIATLTGVALLLIVVIQNRERVNVDFLIWSFTWPLWLFALAMAVVGALVWFGMGVLRRHRRRVARREARRD